ncbi:MAG: HU family DNA-binding protein [Pseudomonadota bacterium]
MAVKRKTTKKKAPAKKAAKKTTTRKTATRKTTTRKTTTRKTAAKKATPEVVTLRHLAAELAEAHEIPKKQAEELLGDFIDRMGGYLKKGKKLRISGLGILQVRKRAARMGRNPATGESIRIKASKKVAFRVAKDLKERVL